MQIDLNRYDAEGDRPSLRLSFSSYDQAYYLHRDFHGPYQTLVRICVLRVTERDLRASNLARRCLEELQQLGTTYGGGYIRIRHNDAARVLIARIAELCAGPNDPAPTNPIMPDHEAMMPGSVGARR